MKIIKLTRTTEEGTALIPYARPRVRVRQKSVSSLVKVSSMDSEQDPFQLGRGFSGQPDFAKETGRRGVETRGISTGPATTAIINGIVARRRSRFAVLASPYAKRAIKILKSNVVGSGLKFISEAPDPEFKTQVDEIWGAWTKVADTTGQQSFEAMQGTVYESSITGGDCFVRFRPRRTVDNLPVPLQLQIIESEQVPLFKNEKVGKANIVAGIQFDVFGKPSFYHMFQAHPADFMMTSIFGLADTVKIPAEDILHIHEIERPSDVRGMPVLAQMVIKLSDLDRYMDAELVRKKASALIGGFITEPYDQQHNNPFLPNRTDADREEIEIEAMEAGTFPILPQGFDVRFTAPADVGLNFQTFLREQVNMIAASVNVLPSQLTGDIVDISDRTLRAQLLEQRRMLVTVQKNLVVFQFCEPVKERFFDMAFISGALVLPEGMTQEQARKGRWVADPWKHLHPEQEIKAEKLEMEIGVKNRDEALIERGKDPEAFDERVKLIKEREEEKGISFGKPEKPSAEEVDLRGQPEDNETTVTQEERQ